MQGGGARRSRGVSECVLDYMLFEAVHLFTEAEITRARGGAGRSGAAAAKQAQVEGGEGAGTAAKAGKAAATESAEGGRAQGRAVLSRGADGLPAPEVVRKLENMGFCVGKRLMERHTWEAKPRLENIMSIMKFICKDFWTLAFRHTASRLQTNHRGVFVIEDYSFQMVQGIGPVQNADANVQAAKYLCFPCGLLRGALSCLGVSCIVNVKVDQLPLVKFNVQCNPLLPTRA